MSLQVEKLEKNMAKLTIEASAEDFEKAIQKVYLKARGRINIPGFRKGKETETRRFRLRRPLRKRNEGVYSHSAHGAGSPPLYQSQQRRYSGNA